jgi:hypothetical protein
MWCVENVAFMECIQISVQNAYGGPKEKRTLERVIYIYKCGEILVILT